MLSFVLWHDTISDAAVRCSVSSCGVGNLDQCSLSPRCASHRRRRCAKFHAGGRSGGGQRRCHGFAAEKTLAAPAENRVQTPANVPEPAPRPVTPRPTARPAPAKLVRAIQRELSDRGYAVGEENGVLGLQSRAAIIAYEFDEQMPLTGEASEAVLKSLIFGRAAGKGGPGPAERFEKRRRLVTEVQETLAGLRYRTGPANGRLDAETREAIRKFESDHRLQAEGRLTERVLLELVIVTGRSLDANG